jgi:nicotinamide-nucleotide amidase
MRNRSQRGPLFSGMQIDEALVEKAAQLLKAAQRAGVTIVTAESCTAGLLSNVLSLAPGASKQLHGGFVTYTKEAKTRVLGVPADVLKHKTAVCEDVAIAMAEGAISRSPGDIAIAVTGVAGPEPDEDGNPVGLVYCATTRQGAAPRWVKLELGDIGREEILRRTLQEAMALAQKSLNEARQPAAASS